MTSRSRNRRRGLAALMVAGVLLAGCSVQPPEPVREPLSEGNEGALAVLVAVDRIGIGFNPHLAADQSAVTTAVATMSLPSAFEPVVRGNDVVWVPGAILDSANVTSEDPFTVTYQLNNDAQWSDERPITGDDFLYLWKQMTEQPNVVGGAAYRAISDVKVGRAGKEVKVTFHTPYAQWRELFRFLLPQHTLRDSADGFQNAMPQGRPVTGGKFIVESIDSGRDEIKLARNDRDWERPTVMDQVILRRAGSSTQTVHALRTGTFQVGVLSAGPALKAEFAAIPTLATGSLPGPRSLGITLNTRSPLMGSLDIRRGILGIVDPDLVRLAAAGDDVVTPFANTVFAPSDPGYYPVERERPTAAEIAALFGAAGYVPGRPRAEPSPETTPEASPVPAGGGAPDGVAELPPGIAPWQNDGRHMVVRIGVVGGDERLSGAAETVADQLRSFGVRAVVNRYPAAKLYGSVVSDGKADIVVGWTGVGETPQNRLATQMVCADQPMAVGESAPVPGTSDEARTLSGLCDPELMDLARTAMFDPDPEAVLQEAQRRYADLAVYLPIYQDLELAVVTDRIAGVEPSGPVQTGVFYNAGNWAYQ